MNRLKNIVALSLTACLCLGAVGTLSACGKSKFYEAEMLSEMENPAQDYNGNLFYVNSLEFGIADPSVIYVTEGKGKGWFYAYGTSDEIDCHGIQAWRSKDLSHWESRGIALNPDFTKTWAVDCYWAPEVIYDGEAKLYYMFYNAFDLNDNNRLCISVAQSESPEGPFVTPTVKNMDGKQLSESEPVIDLKETNPAIAKGMAMENALDASPFIDPETGEKYLYWGYYNNVGDGTHLLGMKMKDWYTPDYSTMTELTAPGFSSLARRDEGLTRDCDSEGSVNEGPHMMYRNGKYYLTFSVTDYRKATYRVIQAIADDPLGTYLKVPENDGGTLISSNAIWDHIASAGHHAFIQVGEETFIAYHTFRDRFTIAGGRALAVDKVVWTTNSQGTEVMYTNGPSWSMQPLPEAISGYKNVALSATVTADKSLGDDGLLNDGMVKYQAADLAEEYMAEEGTSTVKLTWDHPVTARAIMVYNSYDYNLAFDSVKKIELEYLKPNGSSAQKTIENIRYDTEWCVNDEWEFMRPGGSAVVEFYEMPVKSVTITVSSKSGNPGLALGEIVVLGKDEACAGVSDFPEYSYVNAQYGSSHIVTESETFGTVLVDGKESSLATMYGYDLSHDDGTENAYIQQNGVRDQYAYFKGVYATSFYVEAEFTVTADQAFANDEFPKFGFAVSCNDSVSSTIFFYVDAADNYTKEWVGCAARAIGSSDVWDWGNENLQEAKGIGYKNGNKVKLALLRVGEDFYFICNGQLTIQTSNFALFGDTQRAGVGFLSFNTAMRISNYSVTTDENEISEILAAL